MDYKVVEKDKGVLEIELDDKTLLNALLSVLRESKADAYTYDPHPLIPGFRLHIESKDPEGDLRKALSSLDKVVADLEKQAKKVL